MLATEEDAGTFVCPKSHANPNGSVPCAGPNCPLWEWVGYVLPGSEVVRIDSRPNAALEGEERVGTCGLKHPMWYERRH